MSDNTNIIHPDPDVRRRFLSVLSATGPSLPKEQILLFYGFQESECDNAIYHAFRAEDSAERADDDAISKDLAEQLDTLPENDDFQMGCMYIDLPPSLIARIQRDAVNRFLSPASDTVQEKARWFIQEHSELAEEICRQLNQEQRENVVRACVMQRPNADPDISDDEIAVIAEDLFRKESKSDVLSDAIWELANNAVDEFLRTRHKANLYGGPASNGRVFYHITPVTNVYSIRQEGLLPCLGPRAATAGEYEHSIWLISDLDALENCLLNWAGDYFPCTDLALAVVRVELPEDFPLIDQPLMPCEKISRQTIPAEYLSFYTEEGNPLIPVGRLDFYYANRNGQGKISESVEYYSEQDLVADIKRELNSGVPLGVVLYRDEDGCTISREFLLDLDTFPLKLVIEDPPK